MSFLTITGIAVALAMDAFAVAIAAGVILKTVSVRQFFRLAWHFGLFQAIMPVLGWSVGLIFRERIEAFDHWVAFCLLAFVGGHMIREAFQPGEERSERKDPTRGATMVLLSVATSIDALAVGLGLAVLNVSVWFPAAVIGVVAGGFTILGLLIGKKAGQIGWISRSAEVAGGVILLAIGVHILYDHGALGHISALTP